MAKSPDDGQRIEAARIVAEMMLHLGRGQAAKEVEIHNAAQATSGNRLVDSMAVHAHSTFDSDAFGKTYDMFLNATADSLAEGRLATNQWPGRIRMDVLSYCVQMGYNTQEAVGATGKVTPERLKAEMRKIQRAKCYSLGDKGGGATCPPDDGN